MVDGRLTNIMTAVAVRTCLSQPMLTPPPASLLRQAMAPLLRWTGQQFRPGGGSGAHCSVAARAAAAGKLFTLQ